MFLDIDASDRNSDFDMGRPMVSEIKMSSCCLFNFLMNAKAWAFLSACRLMSSDDCSCCPARLDGDFGGG